MKDAQGHEYAELVATQNGHLAMWSQRVVARVMEPVTIYVEATNREAATPEERHRVYRGQDLIQIIMDWPDLKPCYAEMPRPGEDLI